MVQIIAREVAAANVGLEIQVYPGASLFKPTEQWNAMVRGQLDISAFPLDYASGRHPQFSATLMPGLVKNHDHATRMNDSPFMADIKKIINQFAHRFGPLFNHLQKLLLLPVYLPNFGHPVGRRAGWPTSGDRPARGPDVGGQREALPRVARRPVPRPPTRRGPVAAGCPRGSPARS